MNGLSHADKNVIEPDQVPIVQDMSSDSSDIYDPNKDMPTQEEKSEEEDVLDESSTSTLDQSKPKKKLKKAGWGQLWVAIQSTQGKVFPGEWKAKRKAVDREELYMPYKTFNDV